ncbi:KUP/HAK/KT family potassium transporter [Aerococcus sp. NPDC058936]|uniref:KUP/HAK/KT family potassium transporter n=1 Tax=Aerococcus sp. NPDC058936 TaxID=3346674 RepID=UPI00366D83FC
MLGLPFLGIAGLLNFVGAWTVIRALNPYYALKVLFSPENKAGIFILGSVFLATTGAKALYSDLGHAGLANIRASWPYIKICLTLNYLGQAAWLLKVGNNPNYQEVEDLNPFFVMLPESWLVFGVLFATVAAVIASQALISGSFSMVSEAIKLRLLPRLKILYPGSSVGQMYIPTINVLLWLVTSCVVIAFRTSARMEAAYGLSITNTMLMTTILLHAYLVQIGQPKIVAHTLTLFFAMIEGIFFISSITKFFHGGYVAVIIATVILFIMVIWQWGNQIEAKTEDSIDLNDYLDQICESRSDTFLSLDQTNVVFLVSHMNNSIIG